MDGMGWYGIAKYQTCGRGWAGTADIPALVRVTLETWTGLSLLTGAWVTPAKEGLASMRRHLCAPSRVCAQRGAPVPSLASQINIAVITQVYRACTLCVAQHTAQLALHSTITTGVCSSMSF